MTRKFGAVTMNAQTLGSVPQFNLDLAGATVLGTSDNGDGGIGLSTAVPVRASTALWDPATAGWDRLRTPTIHKASGLVTAAGSTAVWTPQSGKKFRLMAYFITVLNVSLMAAAGIEVLDLLDSATSLNQNHQLGLPAAAGAAGPPLYAQLVWFAGNGFLSAAANNVLNLSVGTALTGGGVLVDAWGTEE